MTYRIGDVEMQGREPSNVIHAAFTPKVVDGGKARMLKRRSMLFVDRAYGASRLPEAEIDTAPCEMPIG